MELTPDNLANSFVVVMVSYAVAFALQIFMMYLNWKQSRVNKRNAEKKEELGLLGLIHP